MTSATTTCKAFAGKVEPGVIGIARYYHRYLRTRAHPADGPLTMAHQNSRKSKFQRVVVGNRLGPCLGSAFLDLALPSSVNGGNGLVQI